MDRVSLTAVEDFERIVQSQRPAAAPWVPVLDYSLEERRRVEGPHARLIRDVLTPTTVLDVGCGPGHLVTMLRELGMDAEGVDKPQFNVVTARTVAALTHVRSGGVPLTSDLVICREVLEHLTLHEIRQAVPTLCGLSSRLVYATTRFSSDHDLLRVDTRDNLDPTHITMMSKDLLRVLFILEGFRARIDLEAQMDWKHLGRCVVYERV